jgi:hypothetical protein
MAFAMSVGLTPCAQPTQQHVLDWPEHGGMLELIGAEGGLGMAESKSAQISNEIVHSVKSCKSASLWINKLALDSERLRPTAAGRRPIRLKHL